MCILYDNIYDIRVFIFMCIYIRILCRWKCSFWFKKPCSYAGPCDRHAANHPAIHCAPYDCYSSYFCHPRCPCVRVRVATNRMCWVAVHRQPAYRAAFYRWYPTWTNDANLAAYLCTNTVTANCSMTVNSPADWCWDIARHYCQSCRAANTAIVGMSTDSRRCPCQPCRFSNTVLWQCWSCSMMWCLVCCCRCSPCACSSCWSRFAWDQSRATWNWSCWYCVWSTFSIVPDRWWLLLHRHYCRRPQPNEHFWYLQTM